MFGHRSLCLLPVALLAAVGGYLALRAPPRPDPPMTVEPVSTDLGVAPVGSHTLTYRITNPADRPRRIIGLAEG